MKNANSQHTRQGQLRQRQLPGGAADHANELAAASCRRQTPPSTAASSMPCPRPRATEMSKPPRTAQVARQSGHSLDHVVQQGPVEIDGGGFELRLERLSPQQDEDHQSAYGIQAIAISRPRCGDSLRTPLLRVKRMKSTSEPIAVIDESRSVSCGPR